MRWILDNSSAKIWEKSRRIGATYAESYKACRRRNSIDERRDYWFSSADESAAFEFAQYCRLWCEMMQAVVKSFTQELEDENGYRFNNYVIEFPTGSRINCMSSNPRRFRSKGGDVCLDEFGWHDKPGAMLDAAMPVTTWGYDISILSTHNGETSGFNNLCTIAKRIKSGELSPDTDNVLPWSHHLTSIRDAVDQGLAEKIYRLDRIDLDARKRFLQKCRARCRNEDAWNQEYMCIPSAAAATLIPYDLYQSCEMPNCLGPLVPHTEGRRHYYLGGDIGREKHLTVFWVAELVADLLITRKVIELQKTPYDSQLKTAAALLANQNIERACIDATGIGDMLVETLQKQFGEYRVEKLKFTAPLKDSLASGVRARFEDKRIRVPAERRYRDAFHKVRKTITSAGNVRYDAASDEAGHADEFWAAAACCEAAKITVRPECILL